MQCIAESSAQMPEFAREEVNPEVSPEAEEDRRILSDAYGRWTLVKRDADIKMSNAASAELAAIFGFSDDVDDEVAEF